MVNLDIVKSMTDMCDGGALIKTRRCSVWSHTGGLEEVGQNHPL